MFGRYNSLDGCHLMTDEIVARYPDTPTGPLP